MKNLLKLFCATYLLVSLNGQANNLAPEEMNTNISNNEATDNSSTNNSSTDPSTWPQEEFLIETQHPYENNLEVSWLLVKHEARFMAIHFEKLETEKNRDFIEIRDDQNHLIEILDGAKEDFYTRAVRTKYLSVKFISNLKNTRYGFKIDRIAWK